MKGITKLKEKLKLPDWLKMILCECFYFALGFFLSTVEFIFGIYPFSIAFLCASRKYTPFFFCGALLSVFFIPPSSTPQIVYAIALVSALALRIICSLIQKKTDKSSVILGKEEIKLIDTLFYENNTVRVIISAFVALGISLYNVIKNGYSLYDIFVLLFFVTVASAITYAACGICEGREKKGFPLALATLIFSILYGISDVEVFGINIAITVSGALVLYISKHLGTASACALGALFGIIIGGPLSPTLAILGLVSGFLWRASAFLSIICAFIATLGYGIYASGYVALVSLGPELLLVSLVMFTLLRFDILPLPEFLKPKEQGIEVAISGNWGLRVESKLCALTSSFYEVGSLLKDVGQKSRAPSREDISNLCLECLEKYCYGCPKNSICWEKDQKETESNLERLYEAAFTINSVARSDISEKFLHRCPNIEKVFEEINEKTNQAITEGLKNDRLEGVASLYELISRSVDGSIKNAIADEELNLNDSYTVCRALNKIGLVATRINAYGGRIKEIVAFGVDAQKSKCTKEDVKNACEKALSLPFLLPTIETVGQYLVMTVKSRSAFKVKTVCASKSATEGAPCGDKMLGFETSDLKYHMLLCDGMGTGENASTSATLCVNFLEKLLKSGAASGPSLSLVNNFLRARGGECSLGVDLLEIDLVSGAGKLTKCGAAPTLIKRGDKVFKLFSKTMPIGIMKTVDGEELSFETKVGDVIFLFSDGACQEGERADYLLKLIKSCDTSDLSAITSQIIEKLKRNSTAHPDDMSICAIEIC